jgi:hypothetical protein
VNHITPHISISTPKKICSQLENLKKKLVDDLASAEVCRGATGSSQGVGASLYLEGGGSLWFRVFSG